MRFCPGCSKKLEKGIFCKKCKPVVELEVKHIHVKICTNCNKYFHKNIWQKYNNLDRAVIKVTRDSIKGSKGLFINPLLPKIEKKPGLTIEFEIEVTRGEDVFDVPSKLEFSYCNNCSKQQGDYFEGVLQLRNIDDNILDFTDNYLKKNKVFVSKEKKQKKGFDFNISNKNKIKQLALLLQKKFGGIIKISPTLHTRDKQTSKNVYRVNVYYEAPDYKLGDVVKVENKLIFVKRMGKTITGIDLKSEKKAAVDMKNKEHSVLIPKKTTISKVHPNIEVLDPETYQSVAVYNKKKVELGEKVKIVNDNGKVYII